MRKSLRLLLAVMMLATLIAGVFGTAGAAAPQADNLVFLPKVSPTALIHVQNLGTTDASFAIDYEGTDADAISGTIHNGSSWTFIPPADANASAVVALLAGAGPFAVSVDRTNVAAAGDRASYTGIGAAQLPDMIDGSYWVFAPVVFKNYNGWNGKIYVQNADNEPVQVSVWFYDVNGNNPNFISNLQIAEGASAVIDPTAVPATLPDGTFSAWIRSTGEIAVVADEFKGGLAVSYRGEPEKLADANFAEPANVAPLVFKAYNNWNAGMRVLNVNNIEEAQVKVSFRDTAGTVVFTFEDTIDARSFKDFFFQDFSDLPQNFIGSATIESEPFSFPGNGDYGDINPIITVAQQVKWVAPENDAIPVGQAMAYNAANLDDAGRAISAPFMAKHVQGISTGLEIQNVNALPGTATIVADFFDASGIIWTTDAFLGPWATNGRQLDLRFVDSIPGGFLGSAAAYVESSTQPGLFTIVGVVNEVAVVTAGVSDGGSTYEAYPVTLILTEAP